MRTRRFKETGPRGFGLLRLKWSLEVAAEREVWVQAHRVTRLHAVVEGYGGQIRVFRPVYQALGTVRMKVPIPTPTITSIDLIEH